MGLLMNGTGELEKKDMKKPDVYHVFFNSIFTGKICLQVYWKSILTEQAGELGRAEPNKI